MAGSSQTNSDPAASLKPRAVLISRNSALRQSVKDAAGPALELVECLPPLGYPDVGMVLGQGPAVCFVDVGSEEDQVLALMRDLSDSGLAVIAIHTTNDSPLILRSLRCGAVEFLFLPIAPDHIAQALDRLSHRNGALAHDPGRGGRVWTVMPAKPNYGATTIACNLAARLTGVEQRRILLADMDPIEGSVGFLLKLKSSFSILDAIAASSHLDRDFWKKLTVPYSAIDVLVGSDKPQLDGFAPDASEPLLRFWRENYGTTIVDSPGAVSPWQIDLARSSDLLLLVTTNELAAVHAAQRSLRHLECAGIPKAQLRLLVNRYQRDKGLSEEAIQTALKMEVFHTLPNDYESVQDALLYGKSVSPESRLCRSIDELCSKLTGVKTPRRKSCISGLSRIFGGKKVSHG